MTTTLALLSAVVSFHLCYNSALMYLMGGPAREKSPLCANDGDICACRALLEGVVMVGTMPFLKQLGKP
jgi:hypothetical protein